MNPFQRARDQLRPINRPPAGGPRDAWVHHGFRAGMVLLIAIAVPWLFPRTSLPEFDGILPGVLADQTISAAFDFNVRKNPARLAAELAEAEASVTRILAYEPERAENSIRAVDEFFNRTQTELTAARTRAVADQLDADDTDDLIRGAVNEVVGSIGLTFPSDAELDYIIDDDERALLRSELVDAIRGPLAQGIVRADDVLDVRTENVVIRQIGEDDRVRAVAEIPLMATFVSEATETVVERLPTEGATFFRQLLLQTQPTLRYDIDATRQAEDLARSTVQEFTGIVIEGQRIITQNDVVNEAQYQQLLAYQEELIARDMAGTGTGFLHDVGMILLVICLLGILVYATFTFHRDIYEDIRSFSVLLGLILVVLSVAGFVALAESSPALIPVAFAGLLAAALFDSLLGLVVVSIIAGILLGQPQFDGLPAIMVTVAGGVTAAFAVRGIRTRSESWVLIALISGAYAVAGLSLYLTGHYSLTEFGQTALFGFANATVCTALAMGAVLPALEALTGRTTEQSLLELSDMNRPLLRRLSREAPGTYAHSINLANLVEAACEAIGADSLLGRVGVYYHDIGKVERPQYFIENQPKGLNPHDRLTPWQSAEILRGHVLEGLRMAEEARLPEVVKAFIREHHGTQLIRYFLAKAREMPDVSDLDPNDFAYPGPKPQTKETGIAMLGDAVESASRTLPDPSPERIRALIDRLVQDRVDAGELDECGLTFRDLGIVKREFAHVLTGLFHHRIDYPAPGAPGEPSRVGSTEAGESEDELTSSAEDTGSQLAAAPESETSTNGHRPTEPESQPQVAERPSSSVTPASAPTAADVPPADAPAPEAPAPATEAPAPATDAPAPATDAPQEAGEGQLSMLDQSAQGDTGPIPDITPGRATISEGAGNRPND